MSHDPAGPAPSITLCGGTKLSRTLQPSQPLTIGHAKTAGLRIPHPAVSSIHCTITWEEDQVTLRDAGSQLGTKINGQPVTVEVPLFDGDQITVGLFQFQFAW